MMNLGAWYKAVNAAMTLRDVAQRWASDDPDEGRARSASPQSAVDMRLTSVVVAALKEAFARDHERLDLDRTRLDLDRTRLEIERAHHEEQRRRAEDAMRLELRRQAAERETGRLRLVGGAALVGWIASLVMTVLRPNVGGIWSAGALVVAWVLLLAALASAFATERRITTAMLSTTETLDMGYTGDRALWLLVAGLAVAAVGVLL